MVFAKHRHESATGAHVFPIQNPLPIPSPRVIPVHQPWAPCLMWLCFYYSLNIIVSWLVNRKIIELYITKESEVAKSCPTLCNPMDCSPPGSSLHGILQARVLEWVVISFCRGSSRPRDRTQVSRIPGRRFNLWATREALKLVSKKTKQTPVITF